MIGIVRGASLIVLAMALAGCKMTLTNRVDVNGDGSALVHVISTVDDQMYNLAKSQSKGADPFARAASPAGWETTRRVADNGDHMIEWTKRAGSLAEIQPVLESFYADSKMPAAQTKSVPGMSPTSWTFKVDQQPGLFTRTIHFRVDVPRLLPASKPSSGASSQQLGDEMARTMMATVLTVNTELKLPGKIVSSNGEQLADGRIRFTHAIDAPSKIDVVAEVSDYGHIAFAVVVVLGIVVLVAVVALRRRGAVSAGATGP